MRAVAVIAVGYVLLAVPPAEGIASLILAPLLLVIGYCVLVPAAILGAQRGETAASDRAPRAPGDAEA